MFRILPREMVFTNPVRERIILNYGDYIEGVEFIEKEEYEIMDSLQYPLYDLQLQFTSKIPSQEVCTEFSAKSHRTLISGFYQGRFEYADHWQPIKVG